MADELGNGHANRIGRLERDYARLDQRLADTDKRVGELTPLLTSVVTLTVEFTNLRSDLNAFMKRVDDRDKENARDRVISKRFVIGLAVSLLVALIGAIAVVASAHK